MDSQQVGTNIKKKWKILIAATGSVASIKVIELVRKIRDKAEVKVVLTESAKKFVDVNQLADLGIQIYEDQAEYRLWTKRGDPVLHVQLRKWADCMVIAPLSGNTLAKIANGMCDNLVTLISRCWDMTLVPFQSSQKEKVQKILKNPLIVCPAMNTMMWSHPITEEQLQKLQKWGYVVVSPIEKTLICGDTGKGAMAEVETIILRLQSELNERQQMISKETEEKK